MTCDPRVIVQQPQRPLTITRSAHEQVATPSYDRGLVVERPVHDHVVTERADPNVEVEHPLAQVIVRVVPGPQGPPGQDGSPGGATGPTGATGPAGAAGQIRFTGHGPPPTVIVGASPADTYLDLDSGDVYKLE